MSSGGLNIKNIKNKYQVSLYHWSPSLIWWIKIEIVNNYKKIEFLRFTIEFHIEFFFVRDRVWRERGGRERL